MVKPGCKTGSQEVRKEIGSEPSMAGGQEGGRADTASQFTKQSLGEREEAASSP